jgi:hypothetical protein
VNEGLVVAATVLLIVLVALAVSWWWLRPPRARARPRSRWRPAHGAAFLGEDGRNHG